MAVKTKTHPDVARARQGETPAKLNTDIRALFAQAVTEYQAEGKRMGLPVDAAGYDVANTIIDIGNALRDENKPSGKSDGDMPQLGDFDDDTL